MSLQKVVAQTHLKDSLRHIMVEEVERTSERVLCYSTLLDDNKKNTTLFRHPIFSFNEDLAWPPKGWEKCDCWHCIGQLQHPPVPLVQDIESETGKYAVYGLFCSFSCAKAYIYERQPWSAGDKLLLLEDMAATVFGNTAPIIPAPPQQRLDRFGGDMTLEDFRSEHCIYAVNNPPLISFPETYDRERADSSQATDCFGVRGGKTKPVVEKLNPREDNIRQASQSSGITLGAGVALGPNPYASFCHRVKTPDGRAAPVTISREDVNTSGTLSAFMRKPKAGR